MIDINKLLRETIQAQNLPSLRRLVQHGRRLSINIRDSRGNTALHDLITLNWLDGLRVVLRHPHIDPNTTDGRGTTPFYLACELNYHEAAMALIDDQRVDVELARRFGPSVLVMLSVRPDTAILAYLLRARPVSLSKIRGVDDDQDPLFLANAFGIDEAVRLLEQALETRGGYLG